MTLELIPLPAFSDNYIWLLHNGREALVVDPGDAEPVQAALAARPELKLTTLLITHHHGDHTGGIDQLRTAHGAQVLGPATENIPQPCTPLRHGDTVHALGLALQVLDVPGHTAGHIAFHAANTALGPLLFCGDTLFSGGCGRLFEGTPAQMLASLDQLSQLNPDTQICCAHEYTLSNLKFALAVEPGNDDLVQYIRWCEAQRLEGHPTLPSRMGLERAINPFLRSRMATVREALASHLPSGVKHDDAAYFGALRQWKNEFR